jgi:hypothetical protein
MLSKCAVLKNILPNCLIRGANHTGAFEPMAEHFFNHDEKVLQLRRVWSQHAIVRLHTMLQETS